MYKEKNITPTTIVKDLRNLRITDDEAIKQLKLHINKKIARVNLAIFYKQT